jgi:hypothetical protein
MPSLNVSGRTLQLPSLIPSISSFETLIEPELALTLQIQLQEPVSLISAYDLKDNPRLAELAKRFRRTGVMFLDSGGYEYLRKASYCKSEAVWDMETFLSVAEQGDTYDFVFSFDLFPVHQEEWQHFADRIDDLIDRHGISPEKLIPVVHLRSEDKGWGFNVDDSQRLIDQVATSNQSKIVAVTERELGSGLQERIAKVRLLKEALREGDIKLHVLGCGNPLTFGLIAAAGADICDGLEWCRTCCGIDMKLYHFQHRDLMDQPREWFNPLAKHMFDDTNKYNIKTLVWNLNNFANYIDDIQRLSPDEMSPWLESRFPIVRAA